MSNINILIVDDDPVNLEILEEYLDDEGMQTTSMESALDALAYLRKGSVETHLILLDRMMPVMDGVTFMHTIQADKDLKKIPVIMVTAAAMSHQVDELANLPLKGLVTKPFEREKLLEAIFTALQS